MSGSGVSAQINGFFTWTVCAEAIVAKRRQTAARSFFITLSVLGQASWPYWSEADAMSRLIDWLSGAKLRNIAFQAFKLCNTFFRICYILQFLKRFMCYFKANRDKQSVDDRISKSKGVLYKLACPSKRDTLIETWKLICRTPHYWFTMTTIPHIQKHLHAGQPKYIT